jgi:fimbrial chaperone protein
MSQAACGLAFFCAAVFPAAAGSFSVTPVRTVLSAGQQVASLVVKNDGADPAVVQLELVSWSQQDGKDVYAATREILATPPIFTVPAGGSQVVRVGLRRAPDPRLELTYRVFMQEVPPPPKGDFKGLRVALRLGIPVFVTPSQAAAPVLRWRAARSPDGLKLTLSNTGNAHVQVTDLRIAPAGGKDLYRQPQSVYVLPGRSRDWLLKASPPAGAPLRLYARTDSGDVQADVVVE